jgi:hypothetical protein
MFSHPTSQTTKNVRIRKKRLKLSISRNDGITLMPSLAKRLRKHRNHVLRFLYVDELDATNNLAERQLRPAVITRKTNGCNRTEEGAHTHAILGSVLATCRQQAIPILEYLVKLQRFGETPPSLTNDASPLLC